MNMENTNALITVAMLAAIYENHQKDYLDIITPFVCNLLPSRGYRVDFLQIKQRMESEYGFINMPIGVLEIIVHRFSKENPLLCVHNGKQYIMCGAYNNDDFRTRRTNIKATCTTVAEALKAYLSSERAMSVDVDRCTSELLRFLDQCGHHILKYNSVIRSLPVDERIKRYIACFIQMQKENKSIIYDHILELARGYMVYRCIYFFSQSGTDKSKISLKNVTVYLDTPLIINLLGFDTEIRKQAVWDAVNLAKSLGARVTVLQHNVEEAQGILNAYIAAYPRVQTFNLQFLTLKGYSSLTVREIAERIPVQITSDLDESIDAAPGLGTSSDWDQINTEESLRRFYLQSIQGKEKDEIRRLRIENDVRTLAFAMKIRDGDRPKEFANCKVIVLSDSKTARQAAQALYGNTSRDEVDLVYSLNDFSCLAWLASPSPSAEIAEDLLMYNAAAALEASDAVIEQMLKYVDELTETGAMGEEMAFLLRTHPEVKSAITEVTGNDEKNFTPDMLREIYERAVGSRADEIAASKYEPQLKGLEERLKDSTLQKQEITDALRRERQKDSDRFQKLSSKAQQKAQKATRDVRTVLRVIVRSFQIIAICFVLYALWDGIKSDFAGNEPISILSIAASVFVLVSAVDFFIPKLKFADKWICKIANEIGDRVYENEVNHGREYLDL